MTGLAGSAFGSLSPQPANPPEINKSAVTIRTVLLIFGITIHPPIDKFYLDDLIPDSPFQPQSDDESGQWTVEYKQKCR